MKDLATLLLRSLPLVIFISACCALAGCATMDKIAQDEQAYNTQQCKAFGLLRNRRPTEAAAGVR